MPDHDADAHIGDIVTGLVTLARLLDARDFADLLGAVSVEVETGFELATERRFRRRTGNVVPFPVPGLGEVKPTHRR